MNFWWDYREVWSRHAWLMGIAALAVLMILGGIVGTALQNLLALLFIPGLGLLYMHHLLVHQRMD